MHSKEIVDEPYLHHMNINKLKSDFQSKIAHTRIMWSSISKLVFGFADTVEPDMTAVAISNCVLIPARVTLLLSIRKPVQQGPIHWQHEAPQCNRRQPSTTHTRSMKTNEERKDAHEIQLKCSTTLPLSNDFSDQLNNRKFNSHPMLETDEWFWMKTIIYFLGNQDEQKN